MNTTCCNRPARARSLQGFSLVELLVVMAIIAILASIVVPNAAKYISQGRATRALSEINSITMSLTKILSDSGKSSLNELFKPTMVEDAFGGKSVQYLTDGEFRQLQETYTYAFYVLLRQGRAALRDPQVGTLFDEAALQKLGAAYLDLNFDPWGSLYQIWPGPWSSAAGPTVFRTYQPPQASGGEALPGETLSGDALTLENVRDPETEETMNIGFPAPRNVTAYIYSIGENKVTGQAKYVWTIDNDGNGSITDPHARTNYRPQEPEFMGGGDDVNNWDKDRTWMRFYN
jgi:prepilin-type N-terminal cleavage/methylation domain-containing protein